MQTGIVGLASASIGIFKSHTFLPDALVLAATSSAGFTILLMGKRRTHSLCNVVEKKTNFLPQ